MAEQAFFALRHDFDTLRAELPVGTFAVWQDSVTTLEANVNARINSIEALLQTTQLEMSAIWGENKILREQETSEKGLRTREAEKHVGRRCLQ